MQKRIVLFAIHCSSIVLRFLKIFLIDPYKILLHVGLNFHKLLNATENTLSSLAGMTSSAIGMEHRPAKPFHVKNVELSCIQTSK